MKKNNNTLKAVILAMAFISQGNTIASVMLADIAKAFPDAGQTAIQYVMQMGMIGAFPISLASGFLATKIRKKPMLVVGISLIIVGALIPIINHSTLTMLYIGAAVVGAGQGFLAPLVGTIVIESFTGDDQHKMMGLNTSFSSLGSTVLLLLAGIICKTGWVNVYYLYFVAIIVLLLVIAFLPKGETPVQSAPEANVKKLKVAVPLRGLIQCIINAVLFMLYCTFALNVSLHIAAKSLGSPAATSIAMSLITGFSVLSGLVFSKVVNAIKLYVGTLAALCALIGMVIACFATNIIMIYLSAAFFGLFFGIALSGGSYIVSRICKPEQVAPTFSISMSIMTLGIIFSPIIVNGITAMWGGSGSTGSFTTSAAILAIMVIICFVWNSYLTKVLQSEQASQI